MDDVLALPVRVCVRSHCLLRVCIHVVMVCVCVFVCVCVCVVFVSLGVVASLQVCVC